MKFAKPALLLAVSFGLLWFSESFSPATIFEPQSTGWILWVSYAKDLIQPFAFYFFICLGERWLKSWQIRAVIAFAVPSLMELGQFFYHVLVYQDRLIYIGAFDPLDIVMYAIGVGLAVLAEQILKKVPKIPQ